MVAELYRWYQPPNKRSKGSNDGRYHCTSGCHWRATRKADWIAHEKGHYPNIVWLCPHEDCSLKGGKLPAFLRKDILVKHLRTCHKESLEPRMVEACRVHIVDSRFPTQCVFQLCEEEFASLQDRLDHIDKEHFTIRDPRPWKVIQQNIAPTSVSGSQDEGSELESVSSDTISSVEPSNSTSSSSTNGGNDPPGPASGGGSHEPLSQGDSSPQMPTSNQGSYDSGPIPWDQWINFNGAHGHTSLSRRHARRGLSLLPILLGLSWTTTSRILWQIQVHVRRNQDMPRPYSAGMNSLQRELTLARKILYHLECSAPFGVRLHTGKSSDEEAPPNYSDYLDEVEEQLQTAHSQATASVRPESVLIPPSTLDRPREARAIADNEATESVNEQRQGNNSVRSQSGIERSSRAPQSLDLLALTAAVLQGASATLSILEIYVRSQEPHERLLLGLPRSSIEVEKSLEHINRVLEGPWSAATHV